jgi:SAM-dependent methyltransferase
MKSTMSSPTPNHVRRQKEAVFHDQWASERDLAETLVDEPFTAITGIENQHILAEFGDVRGKRILDYGCGAAEGGIFLAKRGATVVGVDVAPKMLSLAHQLAHAHGVEIETRIVESDLIPADTNEFDLIYGNGVLHHVPHDTAVPELARVLKPSGKGCFIEPLPYNPVINVYRKIAKEMRTDDETPVTFEQIEAFKRHFGRVTHEEFWLTTLAVFLKFYLWDRADPNRERYWKKIYSDAPELERLFGPLNALDRTLLRRLPFLGKLCWNTVITVSAPKA